MITLNDPVTVAVVLVVLLVADDAGSERETGEALKVCEAALLGLSAEEVLLPLTIVVAVTVTVAALAEGTNGCTVTV